MARKNQEAQAKSQIQAKKVNKKINLTLEQKQQMLEIAKNLKEQSTFNTDPIEVLVEDGVVENAV